MSGTIFVSQNSTWRTGTKAFDPLVALLKDFWARDNASAADANGYIFSPVDAGLDFISLDDVPPEVFHRFVSASEKAYRFLSSGESTMNSLMQDALLSCLGELLLLLRGDSRYHSDDLFGPRK